MILRRSVDFNIEHIPYQNMRFWWLGMLISGGIVWYGMNYLLPWK